VFQLYRHAAWLLDVPTGTMHRLFADRGTEEFAWSPDGTHVAYHTLRGRSWSGPAGLLAPVAMRVE
jgi:hypothetical protein